MRRLVPLKMPTNVAGQTANASCQYWTDSRGNSEILITRYLSTMTKTSAHVSDLLQSFSQALPRTHRSRADLIYQY